MNLIPLSDLIIPADRQRRHFDEEALDDLAGSILALGLLHAPVVQDDGRTLVAGERRARAIQGLYDLDLPFRYGGAVIPIGFVPVVNVSTLDAISLREAQLQENLIREDLTWGERAAAIAELHALRQAQATERGDQQTATATAQELGGPTVTSGDAVTEVTTSLIVAQHLDDPEIAKASSLKEATKILRQRAQRAHHEELARTYDLKSLSDPHLLIHGDLFVEVPKIAGGSFDCIIMDPPYGVYADEWDNQSAVEHSYVDTPELSDRIIAFIAAESIRVTKPQAHLFCFIDIRRFEDVCRPFRRAGWQVFHTPLIWNRGPEIGLLPWPSWGPRRTYECIIYANKGKRPFPADQIGRAHV